MTESEAIVTQTEGGDVVVELCGDASCGQCGGKHACGVSMDGDSTRRFYRLPNTVGARPGDRVVLAAASGPLLKAVAFSYVVPIVAALAGAAIGSAWGGDVGALAGCCAGLAVGLLLLRFFGNRMLASQEPLLTMRLKHDIVFQDRELQ